MEIKEFSTIQLGNGTTILDEGRSASSPDRSMRLRFPFLVADTENANRRVYPRAIIEKAVREAQSRISAGLSLFGSSGHPASALELDGVSHIVEGLSMDGGTAHAEARLLPTTKGRNLQIIIREGGTLGVSARGWGSTRKDARGRDVIQDDYQLAGVDFVVDPAFNLRVGSANIYESRAFGHRLSPEEIDLLYAQARLAGFRGDKVQYVTQVLGKR